MKRHLHVNASKLNFSVVGPRGAIHFWTAPPDDAKPGRHFSGIEIHSPRPLYEGHSGGEPCWLLKGPCYHDGSSLQAQERWEPVFKHCNESGDFEPLWTALENEYMERFIQ